MLIFMDYFIALPLYNLYKQIMKVLRLNVLLFFKDLLLVNVCNLKSEGIHS